MREVESIILAEKPYHEELHKEGEVRLLQAILLQAFIDISRATYSGCNQKDKSQAINFLLSRKGKWRRSRELIAGAVGYWTGDEIRSKAIEILGSDNMLAAFERSKMGFKGGSLVLTGGLKRLTKIQAEIQKPRKTA